MINEAITQWALRELTKGRISDYQRQGEHGFDQHARRILEAVTEMRPGKFPVICNTCDPSSVKWFEEGTEISEPFICVVCVQRRRKREVRAENAKPGRMGHGEIVSMGPIGEDVIND